MLLLLLLLLLVAFSVAHRCCVDRRVSHVRCVSRDNARLHIVCRSECRCGGTAVGRRRRYLLCVALVLLNTSVVVVVVVVVAAAAAAAVLLSKKIPTYNNFVLPAPPVSKRVVKEADEERCLKVCTCFGSLFYLLLLPQTQLQARVGLTQVCR